MITKRIAELRNIIEVNTQRLRSEALDRLKQLFDLASEIALGGLKTINLQEGKPVKVTLKQRQMWARIAAYIAQIMNGLADSFDEKQIAAQLDELEQMVNEAMAAKAGKTEKQNTS